MLIYAQRPDATAVLEIERWNQQFGRWVNVGSTGIAVFDRQSDNRPRLKHYFDISDTHESKRARAVPLWTMQHEYHAEVTETLEASFGTLKRSETLSAAIFSAVENAVEDNHQAYLQQLFEVTDGSAFEGMDTDAVSFFFKEALAASVDTMLLARCNENISEVLPLERLSAMRNFNTAQTLTLLGTATSDVAETMLREIARTVLSIQAREKEKIRTLAKSETVLYAEGMVNLHTQLEAARGEMGKPFGNEDELQQKTARLREVTEQLKLNEKDSSVMDTEPEETEVQPPQRGERER